MVGCALATTNDCFLPNASRMPLSGHPTSSQLTLFPSGRLACFRQRGECRFAARVALPRQSMTILVVFHDGELRWLDT